MRKTTLWVSVVCAAVLQAGNSARALEVRLKVQETDKVARTPAVVTTGVPFARGAVKDVSRLSVSVGGKPVPAQFIKTAPWDDGSVRWALMDVQVDVPAGGKTVLVLRDDGKNPAPPVPVKVDDRAGAVTVATGPLQVVIGKTKGNLLESLKVDGKELITAAGRGLVVYTADGKQVVAGAPTEVAVEHAGPLRAVVRFRGRFPGIHNNLLGYTVRLSAFAGQKLVKAHVWIENHGAMGYRSGNEGGSSSNVEWFAFDGMAVELGLGLGNRIRAACEGAAAVGRFKVIQVCKQTHGQENVKYKKPPFYTWDDLEYAISTGDQVLKTGRRTDGVVALTGAGGGLTAAVRDFWQNYEKAIELDGTTLRLWLWPTEGQWPRLRRDLHHGSLFDKDLQGLAREGVYLLPGSVHKGHEFILDGSGREAATTHASLASPLMALASAQYYASTEAAPGLFAPPEIRTGDAECDRKLDAWMRMTRSAADPHNPTGLFKARQSSWASAVGYFSDSSYWFGWMDFGDLSVPGRGPVSLHYDWLWIMLVNVMRTGEPAFMRLATDMARHRIDVDQHWSDRDPPQTRGLQRGDFNYPSFHCYRLYRLPGVRTNWLEGVVLYSMLTGEPKALECCRRNAEGLKTAWAHVAKTRRYAGPQGDMAANAWAISSYCAMYKLTGDRRWLDDALALFRTNVTAKWKAYGPHLHELQQIRSQDYTKDDIKYCYSIKAFCLLHHLTGDEKLLELLKAGCDAEFPENFFDAPLFLADLNAYVALETGNGEYLDNALEQWITAFPESKSPPVFLPDNSQWSRRAATFLRAGHLLQYAHWKRKANAK